MILNTFFGRLFFPSSSFLATRPTVGRGEGGWGVPSHTTKKESHRLTARRSLINRGILGICFSRPKYYSFSLPARCARRDDDDARLKKKIIFIYIIILHTPHYTGDRRGAVKCRERKQKMSAREQQTR